MRSKVLFALMVLTAGLVAQPGAARAWWNDDWSARKPVAVDTSAAGGNIADAIGTLPVLIRLHSGNFRFEAAKEDGSDLRFVAGDDKTPLKYHVEKWDSLLGEAFVWVQIPDLKPGAKSSLWLYYGNRKAPSAADAKGTFDADTVLAWHFGERNAPARDSSAWGNNSSTPVTAADGALIGTGLRLDGSAPVSVPATPSLAWNAGGVMTFSVWVKPGSAQESAALYSRQDGVSSMVVGLADGVPFVEIADAAGPSRIMGTQPLAVGSWRHLAVSAAGGGVTLYVDGQAVASGAASLPALAGPALLGGAVAQPAAADAGADAAASAPVSLAAFVGEMDEVRLAKAARAPGYLKAEAVNQGPDGAKFLTLGQDEETASWISGYFAVILRSVTLDGWVVIGILAVMALISWLVMVDKAVSLSRLEKANERFLSRFRELSGDMLPKGSVGSHPVGSMGGRLSSEEREAFESSPLYRIYRTSAVEMRGRMSGGQGRALSAESIAAIRASLDSVQVRELQSMNRLMVMLTIAISGGPFLGLLGTVVGVMITFAAIAASGDVNVNAIAPGIAAALVATVAGLAVAIPALFGYNWLLTRVKNASATMNVFVDELVTKLAEAAHRAAPGGVSSPVHAPSSSPANAE
ncbi:MAG: DUF2341 domain-containing protein [Rhodospirillaceae bacterium]|nr:DUF2341 domain-containing protein [Rhodospirillaceae bacterium]